MALVSNIPTNILACCNSVEIKAAVLASSATVGTSTNHKLGLTTNDTVRATLDSSGNLGIGTDSPGAKLDVRGAAIFNEGGGDYDVRMEGDTDANLFYLDASTDRIGIGTDAPDYTLDVAGSIGVDQYIYHNGDANTYLNFTADRLRFNVGGITYIDLNDASGAPHDITFNDGGNNVDVIIKGNGSNGGNPLFKTDASTGRVGINGVGSPSYELDVAGVAYASTCVVSPALCATTYVSAALFTGPQLCSSGNICAVDAVFAGCCMVTALLCASTTIKAAAACTTGDTVIGGDLTIAGDDLTMGTNTSGALLVADGTNFNPAVMSGDASISTAGAVTLAATNTNLTTLANVTSVGTLTGLTVSGDVTIDTTTLAVDSTNNRVGIGTATPSHLLDVEGVVNVVTCVITPVYCVSGEYALPASDGTTGQVLCTDGSGGLSFATNTPASPGGSDTYVQFNEGGSTFERTPLPILTFSNEFPHFVSYAINIALPTPHLLFAGLGSYIGKYTLSLSTVGSAVSFWDFLRSTYQPRSVPPGQVGAVLHLETSPAGLTVTKLGKFLSFIP